MENQLSNKELELMGPRRPDDGPCHNAQDLPLARNSSIWAGAGPSRGESQEMVNPLRPSFVGRWWTSRRGRQRPVVSGLGDGSPDA
jgi:hypothetical protein